MRLTRGIAVEGNKVDGTAGDTAEGIGGSELRNAGAQLLRAGEALKTGQVCGQAGDMGGSHGGTGDGVLEEVSLMSLSFYVKTTKKNKKKKEGERRGWCCEAEEGKGVKTHSRATNPGRKDISAGGEDVDERAEVGVVRNGIAVLGGTDGADGGLGGGRVVLGIVGVVAGGHGQEDAAGDEVGGGVVDGLRHAAAQGHVGDGAGRAAPRLPVRRHVVDARDHGRVRARPAVVQNLDSVDRRRLGHAVAGRSDRARHVRAVSVAVRVGAREAGQLRGSALEFLFHHRC